MAMEKMRENIKENKMTIGKTREEKTKEEKMREEKTRKEHGYRQDRHRQSSQLAGRHETMMAQTKSALLYLCRSHDSNLYDQGDIPTFSTTFLFLSLIKLN